MNFIKIFELEEDSSPELELHYRRALELNVGDHYPIEIDGFRSCVNVEGSANGLAFLRSEYNDFFICNPITREFIELPEPEGCKKQSWEGSCGFGMSRLTNQYKVVRIFDIFKGFDPDTGFSVSQPVCQVYTLGTESWRGIVNTPREALVYKRDWFSFGKILNGNLHWLARDSTRSLWVSCFDLETEAFTEFRAPMLEPDHSRWHRLALGVLGDRLCVSDNSSKTEICIYLMNGYGNEEISWTKEYVISKASHVFYGRMSDVVYVVMAFADGDILMVGPDSPFFGHYSSRTKAMALIDVVYDAKVGWCDVDPECCFEAILYRPSFISPRDFETENVKVSDLVCSVSQ